jgi:UDP-glucose 4-epimerase
VYEPYNQAYGDDFEDVRRRVPDLGRLQGTLNRTPQRGLDEILGDIIAEMKTNDIR